MAILSPVSVQPLKYRSICPLLPTLAIRLVIKIVPNIFCRRRIVIVLPVSVRLVILVSTFVEITIFVVEPPLPFCFVVLPLAFIETTSGVIHNAVAMLHMIQPAAEIDLS